MNSTGRFLQSLKFSHLYPAQASGEGEERKQNGIKVKESLQNTSQVRSLYKPTVLYKGMWKQFFPGLLSGK